MASIGGRTVARAARAVLLIILAVTLQACDVHRLDGVGVRNMTAETLHFALVTATKQWTLTPVATPGGSTLVLSAGELGPNSLMGKNGCMSGTLIAYTADGHEVARHAPPLCVGDTWVIGGASPSPMPT